MTRLTPTELAQQLSTLRQADTSQYLKALGQLSHLARRVVYALGAQAPVEDLIDALLREHGEKPELCPPDSPARRAAALEYQDAVAEVAEAFRGLLRTPQMERDPPGRGRFSSGASRGAGVRLSGRLLRHARRQRERRNE